MCALVARLGKSLAEQRELEALLQNPHMLRDLGATPELSARSEQFRQEIASPLRSLP